MTDRQSSDTTMNRQRTGAAHPFTPTDSDGDDADTPFVPTRDPDDSEPSVSITHADVNAFGVALTAIGGVLVLLAEFAPHASTAPVLTASAGVFVAAFGVLLWASRSTATR